MLLLVSKSQNHSLMLYDQYDVKDKTVVTASSRGGQHRLKRDMQVVSQRTEAHPSHQTV